MNVDVFAEWLRRQGHTVLRTKSSYWYDQGPRVYQAFPYHWVIRPRETEIKKIFIDHQVIGLRYSTNLWNSNGTISYHVVYKEPDYNLQNLPKKARNDVKRGLFNATVEPISFGRQAIEGWELRLDTLTRQNRVAAENPEKWNRLCSGSEDLEGFESWGLIHEGRLLASLIAYISNDGTASILYQQSRTDCLKNGINNALTYGFTHEVLKRPDVKSIFYGLHSLDAPESVDEFKFRMGYTAKAVRQRVVFHPLARPIFNTTTHSILAILQKHIPGNATLAKAEGLIRFYLQGKKPLEQQSWPSILERQKESITTKVFPEISV